ncbi:MAG: GNAT family N-acetyltransferase [Defluviitaleaceae bacterium]|nr:GNAT family N-acetyltransferase [Defluviitaleaceae bacterium]
MNEIYCKLLKKEMLSLTDSDTMALDVALKELEFDKARLYDFLEYPHNLAFIAECNDDICGFAYGYSLISLDSEPQLFIYSVDVLERFQNMGIGSKLFQYIADYSENNGFSECFVITSKDNKRACRIYEKAGGASDYENEIVYVIKHKNSENKRMEV